MTRGGQSTKAHAGQHRAYHSTVRKRWKWFVGVPAVLVAIIVIVFWDVFRAAMNPRVQEAIKETEQTAYQGNTKDNLMAIHTALQFYIENEDKLPERAGWMDATMNYLRTNNLKDGEEKRKLVVPGKPDGKFGYALNQALAGMGGADLEKQAKTTPLVFESSEGDAWNQVGAPAKSPGKPYVTLGGEVKP